MILEVGYEAGHVVEKTRAAMMARTMASVGWTVAEMELARHAVLSVPELIKEISYARTVSPGVFAEARDRPEVARGRLFTHQEAIAWSNRLESNRETLSDAFEVVRVEGDDTAMWRLK